MGPGLSVAAHRRYAREVPSRFPSTSVGPRARACALCVSALLALAGASAPAAVAASASSTGTVAKLTLAPKKAATTATTATTASSEAHNSHALILLAFVAAALLLVGIAFVIVRDARGVAPASDGELVEGSTPRHTEAALRKRRAKAKAARRQRKRNRG